MNRHRVLVLGVVAAVALGAALWSTQTRRPDQEDAAPSALVVPGLDAALDDVREVRIRTAGDVLQATLVRGDDGWTLAQRGDWPADVAKLREYLLKLSRARRIAGKTDNPSLYYKLGVEDIATADTPGTQLEIDGLAQPVKLLVGRNVPRGTGTYVRHVGEASSWQADLDLALDGSAPNWLQRDLVDIAAGRVARVAIAPAGGATFEIVDAPDGAAGDFALATLPKGREPASDFVADAAAGFLASLRFDDVLAAADAPAPGEGATKATFTTVEGLKIDATIWAAADKQRAQFAVALDEARAEAHASEAQARAVREHEALAQQATAPEAEGEEAKVATPPAPPLAVTDPARDRADRVAALRAEVETLRARFEGRSFELPAYKAANVTKPFEDYLKPKD